MAHNMFLHSQHGSTAQRWSGRIDWRGVDEGYIRIDEADCLVEIGREPPRRRPQAFELVVCASREVSPTGVF